MSNHIFSNPERPWTYAAESGGITNTTERTIAPAVSGKRNFLSSFQVKNASATATEVVIRDGAGGTVLWRGYHAGTANASKMVHLGVPIRGSVGNALVVACVTTATQTYFNAQGWVGS